MVFACGNILDVGKTRVTFTARLSDISAVTEIVNVALKSPSLAGVVCQLRINLAGYDLIRVAVTLYRKNR